MYRIIIIIFIVNTEATIQLGRIQNVNWVLNLSYIDNTYINVSNTTCDQCLCRMFAMNNLTTSMACQQKWMTCQLLFWNATAQLQTDQTSIVYFQTIPNFLQVTINQPLTTIFTSPQVSTVVTTKSVVSSAVITSMKNPSTIITTVSTAKMTTTAVPIYLINPGGELGSLYAWTPSSSYSPTLDNGTSNGGSTSPHSGLYDFYGGLGGGSLGQKVSLTNMFSTAQLDSGLLSASISFWEKSASAPIPDTAQVDLIFLSATNTNLSKVTTGPKACTSNWCPITANWSLPVGTRTIDYVMTFIDNYGDHADAWIDDNTLNVA